MARKKVDDNITSIVHSLAILKPLNDALYQTSGELDPLITLCASSRNNDDLERVVATIEMLCRQIAEKGALLSDIAEHMKSKAQSLNEAPKEEGGVGIKH